MKHIVVKIKTHIMDIGYFSHEKISDLISDLNSDQLKEIIMCFRTKLFGDEFIKVFAWDYENEKI
jgi:hypothetical protein